MSAIKLTTQMDDIIGTSFHSVYFDVNPSDLFLFFDDGHLNYDGYKTTKEWAFVYKDKVFTLYDWKSTSAYDEDYMSSEEFWAQESVELHIGSSYGAIEEREFAEALESASIQQGWLFSVGCVMEIYKHLHKITWHGVHNQHIYLIKEDVPSLEDRLMYRFLRNIASLRLNVR
jgi:hypothetical protein